MTQTERELAIELAEKEMKVLKERLRNVRTQLRDIEMSLIGLRRERKRLGQISNDLTTRLRQLEDIVKELEG